jgi:hypothetical protein
MIWLSFGRSPYPVCDYPNKLAGNYWILSKNGFRPPLIYNTITLFTIHALGVDIVQL